MGFEDFCANIDWPALERLEADILHGRVPEASRFVQGILNSPFSARYVGGGTVEWSPHGCGGHTYAIDNPNLCEGRGADVANSAAIRDWPKTGDHHAQDKDSGDSAGQEVSPDNLDGLTPPAIAR